MSTFRALLWGFALLLNHAVAFGQAAAVSSAAGERFTLSTDPGHVLFVPDGLSAADGTVDVLAHFHGRPGTIHDQAAWAGLDAAVLTVNYAGRSSVYRRPFSDPALFGQVLDAARDTLGARPGLPEDVAVGRLALSSFSAGYAAIREILKRPEDFARIDGLLLADSLYASFTSEADRTPSDAQMAGFRAFAEAAAADLTGEKTMIVTHSAVLTHTYSNTAETADDLMAHVGVAPTAVDEAGDESDGGPLRLVRRARVGGFHVWGAAGDDAEAHVAHLRHLGRWLAELPLRKRPAEPESER